MEQGGEDTWGVGVGGRECKGMGKIEGGEVKGRELIRA